MTRNDHAQTFHALHDGPAPLILYNVWDAATAQACVSTGAVAVATGSHSVAEAHGYPDGQAMPFDLLLTIAARIAACVDVPLSVDFEGGYAYDDAGIADNLARLIDVGVVGVNIEDQVIGGNGLHPIDAQARRIAILRERAEQMGVPVFLNARTDLFLEEPDSDRHDALMAEALKRAEAYGRAGASGFFVPRLSDVLIEPLCEAVALPVNVMATTPDADVAGLAARGVARISHGPFPFIAAMRAFRERAADALTPR
ncbi:isocitrate lyase/phosphoenolpyruvate mutase family protein [uncultured Algimonas sp.]|uniref:isocitrate lyase/PEP mutase family protein n=1 Tax=uncultured Algimonas sp. TaxID=1547920 RepID=UPI002633F04B|nr:isocitrate lyase/phosphoenolpyruvate mutase family protein [uncultured Algimonas sp.]